ncbi:MAG: FAD-dependent oxidoreductase [Akkermansiaceae bacterium]|nr:FAD-dependent oxidoreductase [Akkermansiaceae bacterium]
MKFLLPLYATAILPLQAATFLVEAEQFSDKGGWGIDTQFIESMGSPYLIAHGLGKPVADATTEVTVPEAGEYRVWVRTVDWTARLGQKPGAGTFQVSIDGKPLVAELGKDDKKWTWQPAGKVSLKQGKAKLALKDLSGFDGRADAVLFSSDGAFTPPADATFEERTTWKIPGVPAAMEDAGNFDLVVVGGGYGGIATAISSARMGLKVALIQNREVLGGNGSSEIRVWAKGYYPESEYPLADIVKEFEDKAIASPAPAKEFGDDLKEKVVRAEKNITLFLSHHAYGVEMKDGKLSAVKMVDIGAGKLKRVTGRLFSDCTGHGFIGLWAGADHTETEKGRMGMSNMWIWQNRKEPVAFEEKPWMLKFTSGQFPYPRVRDGFGHAEWFWESGYDAHPIKDLETTRDLNLFATYSSWNSIKNHGAYAERDKNKHQNAELTWLAYIGGPRETLQLLGDVVMSGKDIIGKTEFNDATLLTTWPIDLHYPLEKYKNTIPGRPFIARAEQGKGLNKYVGYPIPYRILYSRNVPNLFMSGRNISVNRDALGSIRVMKTIGMMGVTVGRAAALATARDCMPRDIYAKHLDEAKALWKQPGSARYENVGEMMKSIPDKAGSPSL